MFLLERVLKRPNQTSSESLPRSIAPRSHVAIFDDKLKSLVKDSDLSIMGKRCHPSAAAVQFASGERGLQNSLQQETATT